MTHAGFQTKCEVNKHKYLVLYTAITAQCIVGFIEIALKQLSNNDSYTFFHHHTLLHYLFGLLCEFFKMIYAEKIATEVLFSA